MICKQGPQADFYSKEAVRRFRGLVPGTGFFEADMDRKRTHPLVNVANI